MALSSETSLSLLDSLNDPLKELAESSRQRDLILQSFDNDNDYIMKQLHILHGENKGLQQSLARSEAELESRTKEVHSLHGDIRRLSERVDTMHDQRLAQDNADLDVMRNRLRSALESSNNYKHQVMELKRELEKQRRSSTHQSAMVETHTTMIEAEKQQYLTQITRLQKEVQKHARNMNDISTYRSKITTLQHHEAQLMDENKRLRGIVNKLQQQAQARDTSQRASLKSTKNRLSARTTERTRPSQSLRTAMEREMHGLERDVNRL